MWEDDDAFFATINWDAQEAQAAQANKQKAQHAGPPGFSSALPVSARSFRLAGAQPATVEYEPLAAGPSAEAAGTRSLFWRGGAGSGDFGQVAQPSGGRDAQTIGGQHQHPGVVPQQQLQQPQGAGALDGPAHGTVPTTVHYQPSRLSGGAQRGAGQQQQPLVAAPVSGPCEPHTMQHGQQQATAVAGRSQPNSGRGGFTSHGMHQAVGVSNPFSVQQLQDHHNQAATQQAYGSERQAPSGGRTSGNGQQQQQQQQHGPSSSRQQQQHQQGPGSGSSQGPLMHGQLTLGHDRQLQLQLGYHDAVKAALTRLKCTYDTKARVWRFPMADHDRVLEALQGLKGVRVNVEPLHHVPMSVIQASLISPDDSNRYCHIPHNLETQLMPFQREGIKFALKHGGRALVGDEMGLGKTVQAIAIAAAYRDEWPVLVIAPSSLREQWADALHRWLGVTEDHVHVVHSNKDAQRVPQKGLQFLIVSYNFVPKMGLEGKYKMVILDESHYIKDHQASLVQSPAQRTKATVPLLKEAKRVILLTGTPALNKPKEIFQQLAALVPSANLRMKHFGERYCTGNRFDKYGGACNLGELNALLKGTVMVRRLKNEVLTQLPKKRRQQVYLSLEGESKRELQTLQSQLEAVKQVFASVQKQAVASGGVVSAGAGRMEENKAIMEMYRRTAELKCGPVEEYVQLLLENRQKFLLFAHHTVLLDAVEHTCNKKKIKYIRIDGKTAASERQGLVNRFQENEDILVAILSIRAAGVGLTLTAASTVVFAELSWTPGEIIQAEDRAHRIGQASSVNVYFLHVKNSIDDIIWASVQNKLENVGQALDGQDQSMEMAGVRHMPDKGQRALDGFLSQAAAPSAAKPQLLPQSKPAQQEQQVQQGAAASMTHATLRSPVSAKAQSKINSFFSKTAPLQRPGQQQPQVAREQPPPEHCQQQAESLRNGEGGQPRSQAGKPLVVLVYPAAHLGGSNCGSKHSRLELVQGRLWQPVLCQRREPREELVLWGAGLAT
ncbi:hypothetical protein N2152v2_000716 [Parachlorella kessleri]